MMRRGYQVQYRDVNFRYEAKDKRGKIWPLILFGVVVILSFIIRNTAEKHLDYLQNSRTWDALECFSDDMKNGESILPALDSFCQKVIKGE